MAGWKWALLVVALAAALYFGIVYVEDRDLTDEAIDSLEKWEGSYRYLYLDTKGLPTTGIGNLVKTSEDAQRLPWKINGRPATRREIEGDFYAVAMAGGGRSARYYEPLTSIRLDADDVHALARRRLDVEFIPALKSRFGNWYTMPRPAQLALIDMIYSLGAGGLDKYVTMSHAVQRGDFVAAADASQRNGARDDRNEYVRNLFLEAAGPERTG